MIFEFFGCLLAHQSAMLRSAFLYYRGRVLNSGIVLMAFCAVSIFILMGDPDFGQVYSG